MNSSYAELHYRGWYFSVSFIFKKQVAGKDGERDSCSGIFRSSALGPVLRSGAWAEMVWDQRQNRQGAILKYIAAKIMHGCADVYIRRIPCADSMIWNLLNHKYKTKKESINLQKLVKFSIVQTLLYIWEIFAGKPHERLDDVFPGIINRKSLLWLLFRIIALSLDQVRFRWTTMAGPVAISNSVAGTAGHWMLQ